MFPVADMFNHDSTARTGFRFHKNRFELVAGRSVKRGREVVISYGAEPSEVLLQNYGFVPERNIANYVGVYEREIWMGLKQVLDQEESLPLRIDLLSGGHSQTSASYSQPGADNRGAFFLCGKGLAPTPLNLFFHSNFVRKRLFLALLFLALFPPIEYYRAQFKPLCGLQLSHRDPE